MDKFNCVAPCLFGLEKLVADELKDMGAENVLAENGRVLFSGGAEIIARANIRSRFAERVQILVGSFEARSFAELFDNVKALDWERYIGVGIGGDFEYAALLSKKALCRPADVRNGDQYYAELEKDMLAAVNKLGIGPQGFGGDTTALYVNIEKYATHIAGLPVAVNIGCHVTRHKSEEL